VIGFHLSKGWHVHILLYMHKRDEALVVHTEHVSDVLRCIWIR